MIIQWRFAGSGSLTTTTTTCLPFFTSVYQREDSRAFPKRALLRTWSGSARVSASRSRCCGGAGSDQDTRLIVKNKAVTPTPHNFAPPLLPRLNAVDVLEDEGLVGPEKFHNWSNQRRIGMAIGDKDVCGLVRHGQVNYWFGRYTCLGPQHEGTWVHQGCTCDGKFHI